MKIAIAWPVLIASLLFFGCTKDEKKEVALEPQGREENKPAENSPKTVSKVSRKLLVLGVDGATWTLMDPLLEQGKLPNFKKLIDGGVRAPLKTLKPTASPAIWTTIATGVPPEKHGITDFVVKIPGTDETLLPTSNLRRASAVWNILSERDVSVGVTGWWATYPAEKVKGFVISDQANTLRNQAYEVGLELMNVHVKGKLPEHAEQSETYPPELGPEIKELINGSPQVGASHLKRFFPNLPSKQLKALQNKTTTDVDDVLDIFKVALLIDQGFVEAGLHEIGKQMPDAAFLYLNGVDAAEHHFWKYIEPTKFKNVSKRDVERFGNVIDEYYVYVDEVLGRMLALYAGKEDELTVIVVSDHGHHANEKYDPKSKIHYNRVCSGEHEDAPDGVIIVSGKDVVAQSGLLGAGVFDIAPTILALMGAPVGEDMPGRALTEIIDPKFLKSHPATSIPTHSAGRVFSDEPVRSEMSETLKEKLKGLGYLE